MLILKASALQMRMDRELLRLQKTSFFESTSSSRGGIYYKCFANRNKKNPYIPRETYGIFHYRYTIIA